MGRVAILTLALLGGCGGKSRDCTNEAVPGIYPAAIRASGAGDIAIVSSVVETTPENPCTIGRSRTGAVHLVPISAGTLSAIDVGLNVKIDEFVVAGGNALFGGANLTILDLDTMTGFEEALPGPGLAPVLVGGSAALVAISSADQLARYEVATGSIAFAAAPYGPSAVAVMPGTNLAFVARSGTSGILKIDTLSWSVEAVLPTASAATFVAVQDSRLVAVLSSGFEVAELDLLTGTVTASVTAPTPITKLLHAGERKWLGFRLDSGETQCFLFDLATNSLVAFPFAPGSSPVFVSAKGEIFVPAIGWSDAIVIDVASGSWQGTGVGAGAAELLPSGTLVVARNENFARGDAPDVVEDVIELVETDGYSVVSSLPIALPEDL